MPQLTPKETIPIRTENPECWWCWKIGPPESPWHASLPSAKFDAHICDRLKPLKLGKSARLFWISVWLHSSNGTVFTYALSNASDLFVPAKQRFFEKLTTKERKNNNDWLSASIEPHPAITKFSVTGTSSLASRIQAGRIKSLNSIDPKNFTNAISFFLVVTE